MNKNFGKVSLSNNNLFKSLLSLQMVLYTVDLTILTNELHFTSTCASNCIIFVFIKYG